MCHSSKEIYSISSHNTIFSPSFLGMAVCLWGFIFQVTVNKDLVVQSAFLLQTTNFYEILSIFQVYREQQLIYQPWKDLWNLATPISFQPAVLLCFLESLSKPRRPQHSPAYFYLGTFAPCLTGCGFLKAQLIFHLHCSFLTTSTLGDLRQLHKLSHILQYLLYKFRNVLFITLHVFALSKL